MKKTLLYVIVSCLVSCTMIDNETTGNIYGIATIKESAEPLRATGVALYILEYDDDQGHHSSSSGWLLLKTVTYDDGHFEFNDLNPGRYQIEIEASGYHTEREEAMVEKGRTARVDLQLERLNTHMTVRTLAATEINGDKATLNGTYTNENYQYTPDNVGFIYSTSPTPNSGGTTTTSSLEKPFSNVISNLKKGKYYFQAYAKNKVGTEYGEVLSFEISGQPSVTTLDATNIAETTATLNGRIDYEGDPAYTERGFLYSSSFPNPTIDDPSSATTKVVISGTSKEFSANIAGLTKNTTYYARAYAINNAGAVYGDAVEFSNSDYVILSSDGIMVHKNDISSGATWSDASNLCKNSTIGSYNDWRLPTIGECNAIYANMGKLIISTADYYWTSELDHSNTVGDYYYNTYNFAKGNYSYAHSSNTYRTRCVRTLKK